MYIKFGTEWCLPSATERGYKCENIIYFVNDNKESSNKFFCFVIVCYWSTM